MPRIARPALLREVRAALRASPVVALLGPRQSGKTTLAREALADLELDHLNVVYPGPRGYRLAPRVDVVPISALEDVLP